MGDLTGSVLVCDYVGRRAQAPVSALGLETSGLTVHNLLKSPYPGELTAAGYAEQLMRRHGTAGGDVRAVVGYCAAAPIAQEVAAWLRDETGVPVPLVLIDGEPVAAAAVRAEYLMAAEKLGELLSIDPARRTPPGVDLTGLRHRPLEVRRQMFEGLLELGRRVPAGGPVDPDTVRAEAEMFATYYLDWLSHLIAAHNAAWSVWGGPAVQIVSRDHDCGAEWPGATGTDTIRIDAGRNDLTRHPECASAVLSALRKETSCAS